MAKTGIISEIFDSIQGEGGLLGYRQLFLRFSGCNLNCRFCDTSNTPDASGIKVYPTAGNLRLYYHPNPVTVSELMAIIGKFNVDYYHSLNITGGEPLLQANFLVEFLPVLRSLGWKIHLQTNGTCIDELSKVLDLLDWISMDYKLPSVTNQSDCLAQHREFIRISGAKLIAVKMVVDKDTLIDEIMSGAKSVISINSRIPLILQPVTPTRGVKAPEVKNLFLWQSKLIDFGVRDLRIIPQVHPVMNLL